MSGLRILALSYLASASLFAVAAVTAAHPDLGRLIGGGSRQLVRTWDDHVWQPLVQRARDQDVALLDTPDHPASVRIDISPPSPAETRLRDMPERKAEMPAPEFAASANITILPDLLPDIDVPPPPDAPPPAPDVRAPRTPKAVAPDFQVARKEDSLPFAIPEPPPTAPAATPVARMEAVAQRLRLSLTPEMVQNFDLFLYVSKADRGPLAQRMYVFRKQPGNVLKLLHDWPASTGRERYETNPRGNRSFTATPRGYYEFDPGRMYRRYHSYSWDQDMPNAMFFNWEREGLQTGLAIHAASGDDVARLGQRASAGCVHLSPENARTLYELIRSDYRGEVPRFAYNRSTETMSNDGSFMHDRAGNLKMAQGYKVLTFIEDYGGSDKLAALF